MAEMNDGKYPLPTGWRWVRLGEICDLNPRRPANIHRPDDAPTTFVPMIALDEQMGTIARPEVKPYAAIRKGYTYFEEGDVLFAKITPCMQNGKHAIARNLLDGLGFGTTEFHVLRPGADIAAEWIHRFLRQPSVLAAATTHFTGAVGQRRLPEGYLANLDIPLPPLAEQRRIAAILNEQMAAVERARAAAEAQLAAARELQPAYLREVFESEEAQQWPKKRLGEVAASVQNGIYKTAENYGQGQPFLRMYNLQNTGWNLVLEPMASVLLQGKESETFGLRAGDLLISRVNSFELVGKCAWVGPIAEDYVYENMLIRVRVEQSVDSLFIAQQMNGRPVREQIQLLAKRAIGQASINAQDLRSVVIALPSLDRQRVIARSLDNKREAWMKVDQILQHQLDAINRLPAALLRRAFTGEL